LILVFSFGFLPDLVHFHFEEAALLSGCHEVRSSSVLTPSSILMISSFSFVICSAYLLCAMFLGFNEDRKEPLCTIFLACSVKLGEPFSKPMDASDF
jgi:hypothetical protein